MYGKVKKRLQGRTPLFCSGLFQLQLNENVLLEVIVFFLTHFSLMS